MPRSVIPDDAWLNSLAPLCPNFVWVRLMEDEKAHFKDPTSSCEKESVQNVCIKLILVNV
jgi:hypothetical protein